MITPVAKKSSSLYERNARTAAKLSLTWAQRQEYRVQCTSGLWHDGRRAGAWVDPIAPYVDGFASRDDFVQAKARAYVFEELTKPLFGR